MTINCITNINVPFYKLRWVSFDSSWMLANHDSFRMHHKYLITVILTITYKNQHSFHFPVANLIVCIVLCLMEIGLEIYLFNVWHFELVTKSIERFYIDNCRYLLVIRLCIQNNMQLNVENGNLKSFDNFGY